MAAVIVLTAAGVLTGFAPAVQASCAQPPHESPYVFTGTVESTERNGLVAHVRTDAGPQVEVIGTPAETGASTVDRTYTTGLRYEFHPLNSSSPYQDNNCTRTHVIDSPPPASSSAPPPTSSASGSSGTRTAAGIGAAGALLGAVTLGLWLWRRNRRNGHRAEAR
ncbi:hypothetical protein [Lentzea nigeriaca]|uniref:hypothetical protein n=1 Tax=Lentzea nigeriaca TaxID=1128665 RepID=UPI00195CBB55|nr:hypothetical protein [Lentzea nigeriaca]MBM7860710.1 hypothetical protein [Lentzea nigeriaca]